MWMLPPPRDDTVAFAGADQVGSDHLPTGSGGGPNASFAVVLAEEGRVPLLQRCWRRESSCSRSSDVCVMWLAGYNRLGWTKAWSPPSAACSPTSRTPTVFVWISR